MKRIFKAPVFVILFLGILISCSDSDDSSSEASLAGNWRVVSIKVSNATLVQQAPDNEDIVINFSANGDFTGSTSVNQFSGTYETISDTMTMLSFQTTEVADTRLGTAFYTSITNAQVPNTTFAQFGFSFDSGNLILFYGDGGEMVLE
ncbi:MULTISPECIES: META domain-containing protein [Croceitalea]|uniref:META domain-containing protein n=1 Tax=Croceitalea vernalis TaxID=3075599 RepID=A0ABU3BET2_9FLAO|nr:MULTISPECIES: META domain-containing protein [unclassified Croceitalea]MDT0538881.1 META domain-containing protein [Croceitalea sp. P059]MDT0620668.1 META domain-containing protein [Croceitalea sp. P007]